MLNSKLIFRSAVLFFIIIETFSIIRGYIIIRDWIPVGIMILISLFLYPKAFRNRSTIYFLCYSFILVIFVLADPSSTNLSWAVVEFMFPFSCFCLINIFRYNGDIKWLKLITIVGLLIIIVSSLMTIPIAIDDPQSVRQMAIYIGEADFSTLMHYNKMGMVSSGLIHAFPVLVPMLVFQLKYEKAALHKLFYLIAIMVPFFMLIKAAFTTPIILAVIGLIVSLGITKRKGWNIMVGAILVLFLFLSVSQELIISGLDSIKPSVEGTAVEEKIQDISTSIMFDEQVGDVASRVSLYNKSWDTFIAHPLFGSMTMSSAGGHAFFIDRLAYFGILGTLPFFLFFYECFKRTYSIIDGPIRKYYLISIFVFVSLGFSKNINGIENFMYLFVFIPALSLSDESFEKNTDIRGYDLL